MNKKCTRMLLAVMMGTCMLQSTIVYAEPETSTPQEYVASTDTSLKSLAIEGVELSPAFDPEVTEYTATIGETVQELTILADPSYPYATVDGDGRQLLKDDKPSYDFKITVTSEDWSTKDYIIHVTREINEELSVSLTGNQLTFVDGDIDQNKVPKGFISTPMMYLDQEIQVFSNSLYPFRLVYLEDADKKQDWYCFDRGSVTSVFRTLVINNTSYYYAGVPKKLQKQSGFSFGDVVLLGEHLKGWHINDKKHTNEMMLYLYDMNGKADYYIFNSENSTLINRTAFEVTQDKESKNFFTTPLFAAILIIIIGTIGFGYVFLASSRHDTVKESLHAARNYFKKPKEERKKEKDESVEIIRTNKKRVFPEAVMTTEIPVIKEEPQAPLQGHLYEEPDIFKAALNHLNTSEIHPEPQVEEVKVPSKQPEVVEKPKKSQPKWAQFLARPLPEKKEAPIPERFIKEEEAPMVEPKVEEEVKPQPAPEVEEPIKEEEPITKDQPLYDEHDYMNEIYDYIDNLFYKEK